MKEERAILHSDLNCFYASVEMMLDPKLKGKAVAVCGNTESRHGIVLAKSEKAKKAGVKTGMANWQARQCCPGLIVVPPQYDQYVKYSKLMREIYRRYTDLIEPFGMDECWCDVTASRYYGSAMEIAEEIRAAAREELGLTVSIGVSFNKIFAKLGSDMKKPDAITEITPGNFKEKVWPLSADEMIYCGKATAAKLAYYGIHTIGDIAATDPELMRRWLGVNGLALWRYANGADTSRVAHKDYVPPIKSVGHGITCVCDLSCAEDVWRVILELSQDVGHRLRVNGLAATGVQLSVRCSDLGFEQYQARLESATQLPSVIAHSAMKLFSTRYRWDRPVRAVCVRATTLIPANLPVQTTLFEDTPKNEKLERLQDTIEDLRGRFGSGAITYASLMGDLKMPDDGRHKVRMPGMMYV